MSDLAPPLSLPEGSTSFQPGSNSSTSLNVGSAAQSQRQIQIHLPNSTGIEALSADKFPYEEFMGRWEVVWSTLPLWKVSDRFPALLYFVSLGMRSRSWIIADLVYLYVLQCNVLDDLHLVCWRNRGKKTSP